VGVGEGVGVGGALVKDAALAEGNELVEERAPDATAASGAPPRRAEGRCPAGGCRAQTLALRAARGQGARAAPVCLLPSGVIAGLSDRKAEPIAQKERSPRARALGAVGRHKMADRDKESDYG
jgi:hypothetical protein